MIPNDLNTLLMPFSANKEFKANPRMVVAADGMYFKSSDGREILDGMSGLWCVNAGHGREEIANAIRDQVLEIDYAPNYHIAHPKSFDMSNRLLEIMPEGLVPEGMSNVFFANSGSEAVESALKIAMAYHFARGEDQRTRLIGRVRGFHGSGFAGMSVGNIESNRKQFSNFLPEVDHLPHTLNIEEMGFSKGQPNWGIHLADELESLVTMHGADRIAAVIVEPMAGAGGVIVPPKGYLERLKEICVYYDLILIFDEVITGFGRLGAATASEKFGVLPDLICLAKGMTNGTVPMGAVVMTENIYQTLMAGQPEGIEFFHGYTYSGHPVACAAGLAALKIYKDEDLFNKGQILASYLEEVIHKLKGHPHVIDIRNIGLAAAIELEPRDGVIGVRGFDVFRKCFDEGCLTRVTGDILAIAPALIANNGHIDMLVETLGKVLRIVD
ncbi:MAG: aspartate aminotransferase family protein [Rhodospirillales bacterium]